MFGKIKLFGIFALIFLFLKGASLVFAAPSITVNNVPSSVAAGIEFTVAVQLSGLDNNTKYWIKSVGGAPTDTDKTKVYTKASNGSDWLAWNGSWDQMPNVTSDSSGNATISISSKFYDDFSGSAVYIIKISKDKTNSNTSSEYSLTVSPKPSSSPSPSSTSYPGNVYINEVMACPTSGQNEWVEIYNDNDSYANLAQWTIRDNTDSNSKQFDCNIAPKSFCKVEITNDFLNNSGGDSVRLFNPAGNEVNSASYSSCNSSYSWAKVSGSWCSTQPTPAQSNSSCLDTSSSSSPSPLPSKSASPKPSVKPSPSPSPSASSSEEDGPPGDVLAAQESPSPTESPQPEETKKSFQLTLPLIISLIGGLFLIIAAVPLIGPKIKAKLRRKKTLLP